MSVQTERATSNLLGLAENTETGQSDISTKDAYFASLSEWGRQSCEMQMYCNYANSRTMIQQSDQLIGQQAQVDPNVNAMRDLQSDMELIQVVDGEQRLRIIQEWGGVEMVVAPFWKRAFAELIDIMSIFLLKICFVVMLRMYGNLHFGKSFVIKSTFETKYLLSFFDLDFLNYSQLSENDLLYVVFSKLLICCYECLWTTSNAGSTPGKYLMNIRLVHVNTMVILEQRGGFQLETTGFWARICPAITPGVCRTLARVIIKSIISVLFFPLCIILVLPKNNRTTYDIITKTLVVEVNTERPPTLPLPRAN